MGAEILAGAWEKLRWGEGHIERLGVEIDAFLDTNLRSFRTEFDGQRYLIYPAFEPAPAEWPLILGDGIHCLRGALDHVMWAMVMRTYKGPSLTEGEKRQIQFPLSPTIPEVEATATYKLLDPYSRRVIRDLHENRRWKFNPFHVLFELSNEDKHRLVLGQVLALDGGTFHLLIRQHPDILKTTTPIVLAEAGDSLDNETPVARFGAILTGPNPEVEVQGYIPGRIEFRPGEGEVAIRHGWLPQIAEMIELTLRRFDLLLRGSVPEP